jgi:cell division septation protein DedD
MCIAGGCGTTEETEEAPPAPQAEPVQQQAPPRVEFETKTDTVATEKGHERVQQDGSAPEPQIRYMVQIGAFKNPQFASRTQTMARQRYHMPVLNDYNTKHTLYQIRIGFFESRDAAQAFRVQMLQEHPQDYKDSWVVQLKR